MLRWWVGVRPRSTPGPHPGPPLNLPLEEEGERFAGEGMIVVNEGVAAVMRVLVVWLVCCLNRDGQDERMDWDWVMAGGCDAVEDKWWWFGWGCPSRLWLR